jgi:hypothetical protein
MIDARLAACFNAQDGINFHVALNWPALCEQRIEELLSAEPQDLSGIRDDHLATVGVSTKRTVIGGEDEYLVCPGSVNFLRLDRVN